jgi:hypothetical protein
VLEGENVVYLHPTFFIIFFHKPFFNEIVLCLLLYGRQGGQATAMVCGRTVEERIGGSRSARRVGNWPGLD